MNLLIDNYDSFSYNLYQLIGSMAPDIRVVRNDSVTLQDIESMAPEAIILSPGPGRPADAGICIEVVKHFAGRVPIFGVCLGHQAICEACGATVSYAKKLMHGKSSLIRLSPNSRLFKGLGETMEVGRYHSLAAVRNTLPDTLLVTAETDDGEIMAVEHRDYPLYGVQFHPESILTPQGTAILFNFFNDNFFIKGRT